MFCAEIAEVLIELFMVALHLIRRNCRLEGYLNSGQIRAANKGKMKD